jgi:hypothetical protein
VFVGTNNPNMKETDSLENPIPSGKCYLDLNRAQKCWQRLERNRSPSPCVVKPEITRRRNLGLSMVTAFTSTSPGLTCPGLLAPDRRDAGSRRVGSRVHGRSEDRGYVVPQASDDSVAGDARWGSRPMAERRVMSEDLLGVTHYRSRRCYESHPDGHKAQCPLFPYLASEIWKSADF